MGDCYDLYIKVDVLLWAEVFEKFISTCLECYGLDSCHYFRSPELSWDARFKTTGIKLVLISDSDMYLFLEIRMRESVLHF